MIGLQYALPNDAFVVVISSLLLGTPALSLIGAIGAALTLGVRGSGLLGCIVSVAVIYSSANFWRRSSCCKSAWHERPSAPFIIGSMFYTCLWY